MTTHSFICRPTAPRSPGGDAVEAALGLDRARLRYGPVELEFAKSRSPSEDLVPPAVERDHLETEDLRVFGNLLFEDVAHLVSLETRFDER